MTLIRILDLIPRTADYKLSCIFFTVEFDLNFCSPVGGQRKGCNDARLPG